MADETFQTDYLGTRSPVSLSGTPALPVSGAPIGASAGPVLPAGAGVAVPGGGIEGSLGAGVGPGVGPPGAPAGAQLGGGPTPLAVLAGIAKIANTAKKFFPSGSGGSFELSPETQAAWDAYEASTGAGLGHSLGGFGLPETLGQVSGGELALGAEGAGAAGAAGAGAAYGASVAPSLGAASAAMGAAAPVWAGLTAFVDLAGEGKIPFQDIIDMFAPGTFGPSSDWMSFPGRLNATLSATESANQDLARALAMAPDQAAIGQALQGWRGAIGKHVGGFESQGGPFDIPDLPGAEGGRGGGGKLGSLGGQFADFSPEVAGLREMLASAMAGATPEDRIAALMRGLEGRRATVDAERTSAREQWERERVPTAEMMRNIESGSGA